ncbi:uncharacterized protein LOC121876805 [Homarus americanus]|uniref:uncharacterized protein LOC121876805 n=1 Tax=Homarus americanus TaxID=6706 RepID=UPI001C48E918|nr:uncharacterized protein LOC121876805 [Homarus americanus]
MLSSQSTQIPGVITTMESSLLAPPCPIETNGDCEGIRSLLAPPCPMEGGEECAGSVNCTMISSQPGATIVSPILLCLTGVIGQVWALCYLYGNTRRQNTRTVFYVFLCTLIWTDFVGKIITTPPAIISYAYGAWVGGKAMCDYHGFSMVLVSMLTHFTVSAMAVERFLGICQGYFYSRNVTPTRCRYLLVGIWVFCTAFSLLLLFNVGQVVLQYPYTWCFTNIHLCPSTTPLRYRIYTTTLGVIHVTHLIIIVVCNVFVVGTLLKMRLSRQLPPSLCHPERSRSHNDHELQMVIVLVVITCVFVTSWAPLDIILVINQLWPPHTTNKDHLLELIAVRLASLNQIVDPWVYIICRVVFRSRAWRCCRLALMGRGWSRRGGGEGGSSTFNFASILHHRKLSRTQSPTRDPQHPSVKLRAVEEVAARPQSSGKTAHLPSFQKSYYSDSGTGSYSGVEVPLIESPEEQSLTPEVPKKPKGSALEHSLAKSLSVAIPIPLFTSEQYRVGGSSKESPSRSQEQYHLLEGSDPNSILQSLSRPVHRVASSASAQDHTSSPFLVIHGSDVEVGFLRSNSWSCVGARREWPQYRTQSTQTLSGQRPVSSDLPLEQLSVPEPHTAVSGDLQKPSSSSNLQCPVSSDLRLEPPTVSLTRHCSTSCNLPESSLVYDPQHPSVSSDLKPRSITPLLDSVKGKTLQKADPGVNSPPGTSH